MSRYVDAESLPKGQLWESLSDIEKATVLSMLLHLPTEDVVPVVHGHWSKEPYEPYKCSICGRYEIDNDEPYCHCGAKMDEVEE